MNFTSQIRHLLTFLAGLGTLFLSWHIIAPEQAAAVNQAGADLIEPLLVICGAVGTFLATLAIGWARKRFSAAKADEIEHDRDDDGAPGGGLSLLWIVGLGMTLVSFGFSAVSCANFQGRMSWDPERGMTGEWRPLLPDGADAPRILDAAGRPNYGPSNK